MKGMRKGLVVALLHVMLVSSLGAKLLYDRATRPRIWVRSFSYDPDLPIRGRYVALSARAEIGNSVDPMQKFPDMSLWVPVRLEVRSGKLYAITDDRGSVHVRTKNPDGTVSLSESSMFFIPERANDPTRLKAGETLWFEATIPKKGPPRPIRLAISKGDGSFVPLDLK